LGRVIPPSSFSSLSLLLLSSHPPSPPSLGVHYGDVVSLVLPNTYGYLVSFFAVVSLGAIAAPLNMAYKKDDFDFYMKDTSTKVRAYM